MYHERVFAKYCRVQHQRSWLSRSCDYRQRQPYLAVLVLVEADGNSVSGNGYDLAWLGRLRTALGEALAGRVEDPSLSAPQFQ